MPPKKGFHSSSPGNNSLTPVTKDTLKSWGIKKVILVGGTGAIGTAVEEELKADLQVKVERLSGNDRYLTALAVAKHFATEEGYEYVVVATGEDFADALAGASLAGKQSSPVLLTGKNKIRTEVLDFMGNLELKKVYILGGEGAIPNPIAEAIY